MRFPVKLPDRGFTLLRYRTDPSELLKYLEDFGEGFQFQKTLSFVSFRGKVKSYEVDEKNKKITVRLEWLCMMDHAAGKWENAPLQELELSFSWFYLQADTGRIKLWTKKVQIVGYFYRPNDPTNITPS